MAGSITAALFLRRFVADPERWAHFDVYCWNPAAKPGRPKAATSRPRGCFTIDLGARREGGRRERDFRQTAHAGAADLAAKYLEGRVAAARFVEGVVMQVRRASST